MLQITLPDELGEWVQSKAASNGQNVDDYLLAVVKKLQAEEEAERQREARILREALESGEPIHADDKWWEDFVADCNAKAREAAKKESA